MYDYLKVSFSKELVEILEAEEEKSFYSISVK